MVNCLRTHLTRWLATTKNLLIGSSREAMTTELEQKIAEQASVIERLLSSIKALQGNSCGDYADEICAEALAIPTDSKKILADWLDSVLGEPSAYQSKRDPNFVTTLTNTAKQWESSGFGIDPLFKKPEIN